VTGPLQANGQKGNGRALGMVKEERRKMACKKGQLQPEDGTTGKRLLVLTKKKRGELLRHEKELRVRCDRKLESCVKMK